jgi:hypothetical protein
MHRLAASGSFRAPSFHAGPESGITNSKKKQKNARPSHDVILCDQEAGKIQILRNFFLPESPFTEMTYHFRGCMTFRLNELDSAISKA